MQNVSKLFSAEVRKRINATVAAAEAKTSAEIVPVIANSSGRYDRAEDMAGLWLAVSALAIAGLVFRQPEPDVGSWVGSGVGLDILWLILIVVVAFVVGAFAASQIGWLRRVFASRSEMIAEVNSRAREIFFDQRIHHTAARGGVLLYVSLFEHIAVVIGDDEVVQKLGAPAIDELCKTFTAKLHEGNVVEAMSEIINITGERLATAMPRVDGDVNELADALVTMD